MRVLSRLLLPVLLLVLASVPVTAADSKAADSKPPAYVTAEVISIDAVSRTLVIRISDGAPQTVALDDTVAGFADVKAGDRVIVSLRREPGRVTVSSLMRQGDRSKEAKPVRDQTPRASARPVTGVPAADAAAAGQVFSDRTAILAKDASRVDEIWSSFRSGCAVKVGGQYEGAREWFSLWDKQATWDVSSGVCRDLFDQIVSAGSDVNKSMASAEEIARKTLLPGSVREIRQRYSMDWGGWGLPAPAKQDK